MILCLNCQHQELSGALFCSECGSQLVQSQMMSTQVIGSPPSNPLKKQSNPLKQDVVPDPVAESRKEIMVRLYMIDNGQTITLSGRTEYTLGRVAEGQPILPDVDFSSFGAYSHGVSRLHAVIKVVKDQIMVMDLGSSNGTRVNGQKITPNIDYPINNGDILTFGKLKLQTLIQK